MISAAQSGDLEALTALVAKRDVSIYDVDERGYSAAHWAVYFDEEACLKIILENVPELVTKSSIRGLTPLHIGALCDSCRSIRLLVDHEMFKRICDAKSVWGETALHLAAATGHSKILAPLIEKGADLTLKDQWERSAIDVAIEHGEESTIKYFRENHSSLFGQSIQKCNLLSNANKIETDRNEHVESIKSDLMKSNLFLKMKKPETNESATKVQEVFERLEEKKTINALPPTNLSLTKQKLSLSKLMEYPGDPNQLKELLNDPNVDPLGKDMFGWSALHKFASWDKVDLIEILLEKCNSVNVNVVGGLDKFTPLHSAIDMSAIRTAKYLALHPSVDLSIVDKNDRTPLDLATKQNCHEIVELIKTRNVSI